MSNELKQALGNLLNDVAHIETAIVTPADDSTPKLCTYSKVELGGDAVTFIDKNNPKELSEFHGELVKLSFAGQKAYWNFFIKALI